jgi:uncharacterized membrane protein YcaP (DUF421 family)
LSIALVTLSTIVLNLVLHVRINLWNAVIITIVLTLIPGAIYFFQRYIRRNSKMSDGE